LTLHNAVSAVALPLGATILQEHLGIITPRTPAEDFSLFEVGGSRAVVYELEPSSIPRFAPVWESFEASCSLPNRTAEDLYQTRAGGGEFQHFHATCALEVSFRTVLAGWARERKEWTRWMWDLAVVSDTPINTEWWPYGGKYERASAVNGMPAPFKVHRTLAEDGLLNALSGWIEGLQRETGIETRPWRPQGFFYYPPGGWREWHTNWNTPGWRMYLVRNAANRGSDFFYTDFRTGEVVRRQEPIAVVRLFQIPRGGGWFRGGPLLWHSIRSHTGRWSFGVNLNAATAEHVITASGGKFFDRHAPKLAPKLKG